MEKIEQKKEQLIYESWPHAFLHSETTKHCIEAAVRSYVTRRVIDGDKTKLSTITAITTVSVHCGLWNIKIVLC